MRVLERRLRRLEVELLPLPETASEPLVIIVDYVSIDGESSEAYRVTVPPTPRQWMPKRLLPYVAPAGPV